MSADLKEFLQEHLPYELDMLRFTLGACKTETTQQRMWNALFESHVVHARNLCSFLTNNKNEGLKARSFSDFDGDELLRATFKQLRLNPCVLHMDKGRPIYGPDKTQLAEVEELYTCIETEFARFVASLPKPWRSCWDSGRGGAMLSSVVTYRNMARAGTMITQTSLIQEPLKWPELKIVEPTK
jgi:hypothetical protein